MTILMLMMKTLRRVVHQYTLMLDRTVAGPGVVGAGEALVVRVSDTGRGRSRIGGRVALLLHANFLTWV